MALGIVYEADWPQAFYPVYSVCGSDARYVAPPHAREADARRAIAAIHPDLKCIVLIRAKRKANG